MADETKATRTRRTPYEAVKHELTRIEARISAKKKSLAAMHDLEREIKHLERLRDAHIEAIQESDAVDQYIADHPKVEPVATFDGEHVAATERAFAKV